MAQLLLIILDDIKHIPALLQTWHAIGVPGSTMLNSVGSYRTINWLSRVGLGALDKVFESKEVQRRTLLVAIEDEVLLEKAIAEAERIVGGFDRPNSGLLLVLPVLQIRGLHKVAPKPALNTEEPLLRPKWNILRDTPIEKVDAILRLQPTIVKPNLPLDDVARAMLVHPNVHVASVVAEDGRLIGILNLRNLADDLFVHILPEEFLSEITDIEKMLSFADKTRIRTAEDAMEKPLWVKRDETVATAFRRMHENNLPGLPIVDERYHVIGYVNLLELLGICLDKGTDPGDMEATI